MTKQTDRFYLGRIFDSKKREVTSDPIGEESGLGFSASCSLLQQPIMDGKYMESMATPQSN